MMLQRICRVAPVAVFSLLLLGKYELANADFVYSDFSSTASITLNGDAAQSGNNLRLSSTPADSTGSAWHSTKQNVGQGFETVFQFQISDPQQWNTGELGGDGFAVVIQNSSDAAIGNTGFYMGYEIENSLAVEFDTFHNHWWTTANTYEPDNNHVGIQSRGAAENTASYENSRLDAFLGVASVTDNMSDGSLHTAKITYSNNLLSVFLDDMSQSVLTASVDLDSLLNLDQGNAWVGFTAGGDTATENHDIAQWSFTSIPEPTGMCLLVVAFGFAISRRRVSR